MLLKYKKVQNLGKFLGSGLINSPSSNVTKVRTYVGDDGKLHFTNSAGADSVLPFSSGKTVVNLGNGTSFNVSSYSGYKNFTVNNFIVGATSGGGVTTAEYGGESKNQYSAHADGFSISKSYNASNGVLSIRGQTQTIRCWYRSWTGDKNVNQSINCFAYLFY